MTTEKTPATSAHRIPSTGKSWWTRGYRRGYGFGFGAEDMPQIGQSHFGTLIETPEDLQKARETAASETEQNARQFSPFEYTAKELNEADEYGKAWDEYEEGIYYGIKAGLDCRSFETFVPRD